MDPVEQIFLQARAPTGGSNTGFEAFVEGQRGARQNRQLDLQERRLQMDEQLHPLEVQARQMTAQHYLLDTQLKFLQAQRGLAAKAAEGRLLALTLRANRDGWTDEITNEFLDEARKSPEAAAGPIGMSAARSMQAGRMLNEQKELLAARAFEMRARGERELAQATDIQLGVGGTSAKTPANLIQAQAYEDAQNAVIEADNARHEAQTPEDQTAAEAEYQRALNHFNSIDRVLPQAGSAFNRHVTQTRIDQRNRSLDAAELKFNADMKDRGYEVTVNPDGTKTFTQVARPMTTGALTQSQESSASAMESLSALDEAISVTASHPEAFGVQGKARRLAEQAKGQLNPNTPMETPIADTQQKASIAFAKVARSLRPDTGNMSRYELSKLEQAGDVLGAEVSPQEALTKQKNLRAVVIGGELRRLEARHAEPDADLLRRIPFEELSGLLADGLLTKAQAERWYQVNRPK